MGGKPIVSIIIDTYNYGEFIEDAIESSLNQTFSQKDIEVIVVDDGSTDDTPLRVKKYRDRIRYIYKENGGQASAFNLGFRVARGEYICLLDADDYYAPCKVERVVEEFERYKEVIYVAHNAEQVSYDKKKIYIPHSKLFNLHNINLNEKNLNLIRKSIRGSSMISLRKSSFEKIFPIPEELGHAADVYINGCFPWFGNLSFINENLTYVRIHQKSINYRYQKEIDTLKYRILTLKKAFFYINEMAKKSEIYNSSLFQKLNIPLEIEIKEREFLLDILLGKAKNKDLFYINMKKRELYRENGIIYEIYKILESFFLLLLPLPIYFKLEEIKRFLKKLIWK